MPGDIPQTLIVQPPRRERLRDCPRYLGDIFPQSKLPRKWERVQLLGVFFQYQHAPAGIGLMLMQKDDRLAQLSDAEWRGGIM